MSPLALTALIQLPFAAYGIYCGSRKLHSRLTRKTLSRQEIARFRSSVGREARLEDGLGRMYEVKSFGDDGLVLLPVYGEGLAALFAHPYNIGWQEAARHLHLVTPSPEAVDEALRRLK